MSQRTLSGVFCDDIRAEIGGKFSLIGCYGPDLIVPRFPAVLPKLCVFVRLMTPTRERFDGAIRIFVLKGDEELVATEPRFERDPEESSDGSPDSVEMLYGNFVFSPLLLSEPCVLRVRATIGEELVKGLGLVVREGGSE